MRRQGGWRHRGSARPLPADRRRGARGAIAIAALAGAALALAGGLSPVVAGAEGSPAPRLRQAVGAQPRGAPPAIPAARCAADRAAGTITFVSPFGWDASAGILDVVAAASLGYFADECLDVAILANAPNAPALVSAGKATVTGEGSAADTLLAIAGGARLTGISTYGDTSDYALLTQRSITNLRQLQGHVLAYHFVLPVILREMLEKAGVDVAKVHLVDDNTYSLSLFIADRYQAEQAYRSNEPLVLRAAHEPFREWTPGQFGIAGTFNVQVVNTGFLRHHPTAVADFLRAELRAFDYCSAHGSACIAIEQRDAGGAANYDRAHELAVWQFESRLARTHALRGQGVGVEDLAEWRPEAQALVRYHLVSHAPDLATAMDPSIAASLYRHGRLVWP